MTKSIEDGQYTVRETKAADVRERWAKIRLIVHQMTLERDLAFAHLSEHLDHSLEPIPFVSKKTTWWEEAQDKIKVYICIFMHAKPKYRQGDQYYTCVCGRKYAVAWADMSKVETDVYVPSKPFVASKGRTLQAVCMNGTRGVS